MNVTPKIQNNTIRHNKYPSALPLSRILNTSFKHLMRSNSNIRMLRVNEMLAHIIANNPSVVYDFPSLIKVGIRARDQHAMKKYPNLV